MSEPACPFCDKLARPEQDEVVWRFPNAVAWLGQWQFYHGYCILVARQHARELFELSDDVRRGYLEEMTLLARAIDRAFSPHKLNYELLGNQVPHLHWHLFPRSADDPNRLQPVWLAVDGAERDPARNKALETGRSDRWATRDELRRVLTSLGAPSA